MALTKEYSKRWGVVVLTSFVVVALLLTYLTAYTKYIFAKDYVFYIEAPCDPESMICFVRDCDDYCPPNGLSAYRSFTIQASTFASCTNNSCENICLTESTAAQCEEIICDPVADESCSTPTEE
jgi:hypothetical protein